jgi:hypothetical protein
MPDADGRVRRFATHHEVHRTTSTSGRGGNALEMTTGNIRSVFRS